MRLILCLPLLITAVPAFACETANYRAFDFWLGEWEVRTPNGDVAGNNSIQQAEDGCLIIERWQGASGSTGQSYNYYNPTTKLWRQVWVSQGAIIDIQGGWKDGAMRLEGEITYQESGAQSPFRGTWTPAEDGSVRQHFEQHDPEKKAWADWFIGIYRKNSET